MIKYLPYYRFLCVVFLYKLLNFFRHVLIYSHNPSFELSNPPRLKMGCKAQASTISNKRQTDSNNSGKKYIHVAGSVMLVIYL